MFKVSELLSIVGVAIVLLVTALFLVSIPAHGNSTQVTVITKNVKKVEQSVSRFYKKLSRNDHL